MSKPSGRTTGIAVEMLEPRALLATFIGQADVGTILAQAASQARDRQAVAVSDVEGNILGIVAVGNATKLTIAKAVTRARTAAFFQSGGEAFTTRTARFIIQDNFPHPVPNTPGGPLYGVQFSSLPGSDVYSGPAVSGDPGGIPLYINGDPVGGVGVAGDGNDVAIRQDFLELPGASIDNPRRLFFNGSEESDFDEQVALAGAVGFMAPSGIRANKIFLDGLRLPFTADEPATANPTRTLADLLASGDAALKKAGFIPPGAAALRGSPGTAFPSASFSGIPGQNKNPNPNAVNFGVISSNDPGEHLTYKDVNKIITNAALQASITRGAIRLPVGTAAQVHIAVVDRDGDILGVFRTNDGTNFGYDVAVQKARTAAFFSDSQHAFSTRGIGFLAQRFYPPGITGGVYGPLFGLQNQLSTPANFSGTLRNGITIFPGGVPLYKNGEFVGAIGISGDGVDQDDIICYAGTKGFRPSNSIRCDALPPSEVLSFLDDRMDAIVATYSISPRFDAKVRRRLAAGLEDVQLPYVKFPRNPEI